VVRGLFTPAEQGNDEKHRPRPLVVLELPEVLSAEPLDGDGRSKDVLSLEIHRAEGRSRDASRETKEERGLTLVEYRRSEDIIV